MHLTHTQHRTFSWQRVSLALLSASAFTRASAASIRRRQDPEPLSFDWTSIEPSTELNWVDCYSAPLQCTRLSVPLNYTNLDEGFGAVPLVSYPSPLSNSSSYRGPVLINPGGPGGSGVDTVVVAGIYFQHVLGQEFDIIGFDPRGVGASTPALTYPGTAEEELGFVGNYSTWVDLTEESWPTLPERMKEVEEWALLNERERGDVLKHATTDNVARDMLSIVRAHGEEKLQYWGISYGTALGSVFASMFPDNVERMIIDGVLDQEGYYNNDWSLNIVDADNALTWFFDTCADAGPDLCSFHAESSKVIRERYHAVETLVKNGTVVFPDGTAFGTNYLEALVHNMLYAPANFPILGEMLSGIEQGNLTRILEHLNGGNGASPYVTVALRCTDTAIIEDTAEELQEYSLRVGNASEYLAGAVEGVRVSCAGWKVNPDNFQGPMGANTSFPLLFVGNTVDPVTPLIAAKQTSAKFPGSRVLTYDIPGHGMMALPGNACMDAHFRNYMLNGTLPEEDTVCEDSRTFFGSANGTETGSDSSEEIPTEKLRSILMRRQLF